MKNIIKTSIAAMLCLSVFTACDDDRDSNPTILEPSTFKLNTPSYAAETTDLAHSKTLNFTWSQPEYGFPAAAQYHLEVSLTDKYTISAEKASEDKTGNTVPDYTAVENIFTECKGNANAADFAKAVQQVGRWKQQDVPATQDVFVRAASVLGGDTIYSNSVKIKVAPYYVELKDAEPEIWYMVGSCIADGAWNNTADGIGTSILPMFPKAGAEYDKKTGKGVIEYAGYFPADASFKIIQTVGDWNYGFCGGGSPGTTTYRNGGDDPGNITVPKAGYYLITVDTKALTCSITEIKDKPATYASMSLPGDYNGWDLTAEMAKPETAANTVNHVWVADVKIDSEGGVKFNSGEKYWGGVTFPYGVATEKDGNIPATPGTYKVFFNDITGGYYFFAKK